VKTFTIGEKPREEPADPKRGPGEYDANDSPTRYRVPEVKIAPPSANQNKQPQLSSVGPGAYDDGKNFGSDVKTFTIGSKKERPIQRTAGPGEYDANDSPTRYRVPDVKIAPPSANQNRQPLHNNVGPGAYDAGKKFGEDVKTFTIGEKSKERPADPSRGPGEYNLNESPTRYRVPEVKIAPPSANQNRQPLHNNVGPGAYDDGKNFGSDVKSFTIGEKKERPIQRTAGPGEYDANDDATKYKTPNVIIAPSSPERNGKNDKAGDQNVGPGAYDDGKKFGDGVKTFTIGEKKERPIERTAGPGQYDANDSPTRFKNPAVIISKPT